MDTAAARLRFPSIATAFSLTATEGAPSALGNARLLLGEHEEDLLQLPLEVGKLLDSMRAAEQQATASKRKARDGESCGEHEEMQDDAPRGEPPDYPRRVTRGVTRGGAETGRSTQARGSTARAELTANWWLC